MRGFNGKAYVLLRVGPGTVRLAPALLEAFHLHAGDRLLIADPATADLVAELLPHVPSIEKVIFFCDAASLPKTSFPAVAFADWIAAVTPSGAGGTPAGADRCGSSSSVSNPA